MPFIGNQAPIMDQVFKSPPLFTDDFIVLGIIMLLLAFIFHTSSLKSPFWTKFYTWLPPLLLCYLLPSLLTSFNIISPEWHLTDHSGDFVLDDHDLPITQKLGLYKVASQVLLPAALILLTISIDLKSLFGLGNKAIIMFLAGTLGVILGGPIAVLIMSFFSPETVGGEGYDAMWRGLSTLAGSWIGGGANQTAMLEIYKFNPHKYGGVVLVDIIISNIWMAILLYGINKQQAIDRFLQADTSAIEKTKAKISKYTLSITRIPSLNDYVIMLGIVFAGVALSHGFGKGIPWMLTQLWPSFSDESGFLSTFSDSFFWMITIATFLGIGLSFTSFKNFEGVGASKIGSLFIYILVATIGMKMDISSILKYPGLLAVGAIWMMVHVAVLFIVAYLIKAPYFFIAVGSMANIGGAASAPVVASSFHASLTSVGVLLAIFGYIIGTYGAIVCAILMQWVVG